MFNILFIGTSSFGAPSLKALIKDERFNVRAIITQPDKPAGRKQKPLPSPIKKLAQKYDIEVLQPKLITNYKLQITKHKPDIIIVIAYAQLIPEEILAIPKFGCLNVHASLLPKYRGAACIQAAILNGDKTAGVTIIKMDKGLDTGPILAKKEINILKDDTAESLHDRLSLTAQDLLIPTLLNWTDNKIKPQTQDSSKAGYVKRLKKRDGRINWTLPANKIERQIRAMHPWPGAFAFIPDNRKPRPRTAQPCRQITDNKLIKIIQADNNTIKINKYKIGEAFLYNENLAVQCGKDALAIEKLQPEGKKAMTAKEFLRGHNDIIGKILF